MLVLSAANLAANAAAAQSAPPPTGEAAAVLSQPTGGPAAAASVGTAGGFYVSYAVEGNAAYQAALDRGLSDKEARIKGIATGLINGGIEVAGGGPTKFFRGKAAKNVAGKLGKLTAYTRENQIDQINLFVDVLKRCASLH